jgi:hypothetical protein
MKTEEVTREPRTACQVVSRALQDLAPVRAEVVDGRGKRVPLSSAGYVLRTGKKYRLRIIPPPDTDLLGMKVIAPPDFIRVGEEVISTNERGQPVRDLPFRVRPELGATVYKFGNVRSDELEITFQYQPESGKHAPHYTYPIVVRPGWGLVCLAVAGTVLTLLGPIIGHELFAGSKSGDASFLDKLGHWLTDLRFWLFPALILLVLLLVYGYSLFQLHQRSNELRASFEERYPPLIRNP